MAEKSSSANTPIPTDVQVLESARRLKLSGLPFEPRVGCFVWDPDGYIQPDSPFPHRVYMILSLHRFLQIFKTERAIAEQVIWVPTEHQTRRLLREAGPDVEIIRDLQAYLDLLVTSG